MQSSMEHAGLGPLHHCLDIAFCNPILMSGTNAAEAVGLAKPITIGLEVGRSKNPIVRVVLLDLNTNSSCLSLKLVLAGNCLRCTSRQLAEVENHAIGVVNKQRSAGVSLFLTTISVQETPRDGRDIVIRRDTVARLDVTHLQL